MQSKLPFNFKHLFTLSSLFAFILCLAEAYLLVLLQPRLPAAQSGMLFWVQVAVNVLALSWACSHLCHLYARNARHIRLAWIGTALLAIGLSVAFVTLFNLLLNSYQQREEWWSDYVVYAMPVFAMACGFAQLTFIPGTFAQLRKSRREFLEERAQTS